MPINYLDIKNGVISYSQKDYSLSRHAHFPIEVVFSLSGALHIETDDHQFSNIRSVLINSNVPHTFCSRNGACQLYFIDPGSKAGVHLLNHFFGRGEEIVLTDGMEAEGFVKDHIDAYENGNLNLKNRDSRIQACLDWIQANYSTEGIKLSMISEVVFLSESRLAHLFREQIGISIHQYILWKKIEMAMKHYMEGCSLTDCAYASGFSDPSHLNKTFRKMFGTYPSFENKK